MIHDGATYRGTVIRCRPIGILKVLQVTERKKEERPSCCGAASLFLCR
ncbi:inorganic diphosphatase [Bradyrhizobium sp. CCBAU 45321]|nr:MULTISPECIES: inorganic diphosphatase [Bradyrhizobium]